MKKRFIPATVAALALSFSAVAVPQAVAEPTVQDEQFEAVTDIDPGTTESIYYSVLFGGISGAADRFNELETVSLGLEGLTWEFDNEDKRNLVAEEGLADGNYEVPVTLTYTTGVSPVTGTINITVNDTTAPVISSISNQNWEVGTAIDPITVEVAESNDFELKISGLPNGITYNPQTNVISGTPTALQTEPVKVTITATDEADNSGSEDFYFTVVPDATAPVITPIEDQEWAAGVEIEPITVELDDAEGVTVEVTDLPEGVEYDAETGEIAGTPTAVSAERKTVTVTATDKAENKATETFQYGSDLTAPSITAIVDQEWEAGVAIDSIEVEVDDASDVTIEVEGLPDGVEYDAEAGTISGTPTDEVTEGTVTVTATDEAGNESETTFAYAAPGASDDGSSLNSSEGSSADDVPWGLVGVGGVLAAVIGVIAAIGGGFIQLPPAIANLIPFL